MVFDANDDDIFVVSYNDTTGILYLNNTLKFYHWGAETSTADRYYGIDMRAEVLLLTRNVVIKGHDFDNWGG